MSNNIIELDNEHLIEYIIDMISTFRTKITDVQNARYHHTTRYKDAPSICQHGILTLIDLNKQGIRNDSKEFIRRMDDIDSHINGADGVSLAVVGLQDLGRNEDEYNPLDPTKVDFLVSSDITARRSSKHYGNEFICDKSIPLDMIKTVDIRFLQLIRKSQDMNLQLPRDLLIEMYNYLIEIARTLASNEISIPLREMSNNESCTIDISKACKSAKIMIKK